MIKILEITTILAGLLRSVGILTTPNRNSPGWEKPVPRRYFTCDSE